MHKTVPTLPMDYREQRNDTLAREAKQRTGGTLELTPDEANVNTILMQEKWKEIEVSRVTGSAFPPTVNFLLSKPRYEESKVFQIIRKMPKGASLHLHEISVPSLDWIVNTLTYHPNCYMCTDSEGTLLFHFFKSPPIKSEYQWELVSEARKRSGNVEAFDERIYASLSFSEENPDAAYVTNHDAWLKFSKIFQSVRGLLTFAGTMKDKMYEVIKQAYDDNIMYLEMRGLEPVYDLDGVTLDRESILQPYKEVVAEFQRRFPDFLGVKYIICGYRFLFMNIVTLTQEKHTAIRALEWFGEVVLSRISSWKFWKGRSFQTIPKLEWQCVSSMHFMGRRFDVLFMAIFTGDNRRIRSNTEIRNLVNETMQLREKYPDDIAGFDICGNEDKGRSTVNFVEDLLYPSTLSPSVDLPYYLHAGETDWTGTQVDDDLLDAILLGTKRIGHGFALHGHPEFLRLVKKKDIAIEVNPVSNQVLKLVHDLRVHPAVSLLAQNYPVVISSDNPNTWGALPASHDFYAAFMALGGAQADLRFLKQLAINSIKYSAMSEDEKTRALGLWKKRWDSFIKDIIATNERMEGP